MIMEIESISFRVKTDSIPSLIVEALPFQMTSKMIRMFVLQPQEKLK